VPELERLRGVRVVAAPDALDAARFPDASVVLRSAPDEVYAIGASAVDVADPHAIVTEEASYAGCWLDAAEAQEWLERECAWELPVARPALAQGMVAGIATKLWLEDDRVLVVVPATMIADAGERMA
jgi:hypothetical protein